MVVWAMQTKKPLIRPAKMQTKLLACFKARIDELIALGIIKPSAKKKLDSLVVWRLGNGKFEVRYGSNGTATKES